MNEVITTMSVIGGLGLVFGAGLGVASKVFAVKVNPLVPEVREALPGANCGACGKAGCDAYAKAIVEEGAPINLCPVGGAKTLEQISKIMGMEAVAEAKKVAFVQCNGSCQNAKEKYQYIGITSCADAAYLPGGGPKACEYGCLGLGSCVKACEFGAIDIVDGIAVINPEKCVACGKCVTACPKKLIEIVPDDKKVRVRCRSLAKGKEVMDACAVGCIACSKCVKECKFDAIHVVNNIAHVDYDKCKQCNMCVKVCPKQVITEKVRIKKASAPKPPVEELPQVKEA
ncbi:RnfABCDGE type electron transport complex subunit B [Clostridiales bacterium COT073_COT-073]|nr:RnfABCDGE type electron transport complex subunit B [Clostridiales bacterium COT073_COT-073]